MNLPRSRNADIVVNQLGDEILVYDLITHKAYNLNKTSSIVYQACGDGLTFDELKKKHRFTDDLIHLALDELKANNLLVDYTSNHFAGLSRREVVKRVGLASMIALPLVSSLVAPTAAQAASGAASCPPGSPNPNGTAAGTALRNGAPCSSIFTDLCQDFCSNLASTECCSGRANLSGNCPGCTCVCAA